MDEKTLESFKRLSNILDTLRKECPWDKVQTMKSLRYLTIEEVHELSEAIIQIENLKLKIENSADAENNSQFSILNSQLKKELGDLAMHILFYCKIAEDEGLFTTADVYNTICDKLIARHPFIYDKENYHGENWEQLKMREGRKNVLEGVPDSLPSLIKAIRIQEKVKGESGKVKGITFKKCVSVFDEQHKFAPKFDENETITLEADMVIFAIGQTVVLKDLLKDTKVEFVRGVYPVADKLTYQTAEPDIFVGGDVFTGPKFAIDAIAAGKEAAESLHRFVQHGHMTIGRNRRDFIELNKQDILVEQYDNSSRQDPGVIPTKTKFEEYHGTLTEEQVKKETARCLSCGASVVDENRCIGCGICTTKCAFDAIHLHREHPEASIMRTSENKFDGILPYMIKRAGNIIFKKK